MVLNGKAAGTLFQQSRCNFPTDVSQNAIRRRENWYLLDEVLTLLKATVYQHVEGVKGAATREGVDGRILGDGSGYLPILTLTLEGDTMA
jgi:hypothetical protein